MSWVHTQLKWINYLGTPNQQLRTSNFCLLQFTESTKRKKGLAIAKAKARGKKSIAFLYLLYLLPPHFSLPKNTPGTKFITSSLSSPSLTLPYLTLPPLPLPLPRKVLCISNYQNLQVVRFSCSIVLDRIIYNLLLLASSVLLFYFYCSTALSLFLYIS